MTTSEKDIQARGDALGAETGSHSPIARATPAVSDDLKNVRVWRVESTSFDLDERHYPVGSWLVTRPGEIYATAMTAEEYARYRAEGRR